MNYKRWVVLFAALSVLVTAVIWGNSLRNMKQSDKLKASVSKVVKPVVDPQQKVEENAFRTFLSKCVHVIEFAALGVCLAGLAISLGRWKGRRYIALPLLLTLGVGVMDEFLQTFSGRGSAVGDILLDFAGGLLGLGLAVLCVWLMNRKKTSV